MVSRRFRDRTYSWRDLAEAKRFETRAKIPEHWRLDVAVLKAAANERSITGFFIEGLLDSESKAITSLATVELLSKLQAGSLTALQVTTAYCKRAAYAHQLVEILASEHLSKINFDRALEQARELDRYFQCHHQTLGPLHGLPVSLKDQWHIKGLDTSMGYVGWIGTVEGNKTDIKKRTYNSQLIRDLIKLGAIPIAKTTVAQSLWCSETNNNITGYLYSPRHQQLSAGGSSGGEGAFQSLKGSAVGFGTDIGGSVLMPAAYNGVYGFKPSHGRISFKDTVNSSPGQMMIPTVVGMLGPKPDAMNYVFRALMLSQPWLYDPDCHPIPYRSDWEHLASGEVKLSLGILANDGIVRPHPPILRAINIVNRELRQAGHEILDWNPPCHSEAAKLHSFFTEADGQVDVWDNLDLSGELPIPEISEDYYKGPHDPASCLEYFRNTRQLQRFRIKYLDYWNSTCTAAGRPVDAVIMPVAPHAGVIPGKPCYYTYSNVANVLDYVTVVIPVTEADRRIDTFDSRYKPANDVDRLNWQSYDPERYDGAPAAVQVLCRKHEEEKVLAIAQAIDSVVSRSHKAC